MAFRKALLLTLGCCFVEFLSPSAKAQSEDQVCERIRQIHGTTVNDSEGNTELITLSGNTDDELKGIDFSVFRKLRAMYVVSRKLTDKSAQSLCAIRSSLSTLSIGDAPIGDKGIRAILERQRDLRFLSLNGTQITDGILPEIGMNANLLSLGLGRTRISDAGLKALAPLQDLDILNVSNTSISDAGLREIANLGGLKILDLSGTKITDSGIQQLAVLELVSLRLDGTKVTQAGKARLKKAIPDLDFD